MPRRKKITMLIKELYPNFVENLKQNPLLADYDMETLQLIVLKKQSPRIMDVDKAITSLERYIAINGKNIEVINGEQVIVKKDLVKMLDISRPTLDKWIENGFIQKRYSPTLKIEAYQANEVLEQLKKHRNG